MSSNGFTYAYDANDFGGLVDQALTAKTMTQVTGCCHMLVMASQLHMK